jgi:hypothetical protein
VYGVRRARFPSFRKADWKLDNGVRHFPPLALLVP